MRKSRRLVLILAGIILLLIPCCKQSPTEGSPFTPEILSDGWSVSSPEDQELDRHTLESGYDSAAQLSYMYSLLVVRHGYLVAEQYFNGDTRETPNNVMSVSKSFLSALIGIALNRGDLDSLSQRMLDFFPEYSSPPLDARKWNITVRHLLMMRAGFATDQDVYFQVYNSSNWIQTTINLPLQFDPGARMVYCTYETHLLSAILTKASGVSSYQFCETYLCEPLGVSVHFWEQDAQGYYFGGNSMGFLPREMAKFGLLYLHDGAMNEKQIVPKAWVDESLTNFTNNPANTWGDLVNYNYGYLWWMGELNGYGVKLALGHGGQYIVLIPQLDMVVVSTANPQFDWDTADLHERAILHIISASILASAR